VRPVAVATRRPVAVGAVAADGDRAAVPPAATTVAGRLCAMPSGLVRPRMGRTMPAAPPAEAGGSAPVRAVRRLAARRDRDDHVGDRDSGRGRRRPAGWSTARRGRVRTPVPDGHAAARAFGHPSRGTRDQRAKGG